MVHRIEPIRATPVADSTTHDDSDPGRRTTAEPRNTVPHVFVPTEVVQISDRARRSQAPAVNERRRDAAPAFRSSKDAERAASSLEATLRGDALLAAMAQRPSDAERVWNLLRD